MQPSTKKDYSIALLATHFYAKNMKLSQLAKTIGAEFKGSADPDITRVSTLSEAEPGSIAFFNNIRYLPELRQCRASAVIMAAPVEGITIPAIYSANPSLAASEAVKALGQGRVTPKPGIAPKAVVAPSAKLGKNVTVMDNAVIDEDAQIGDNTVIYPCSYIGPKCRIGADCVIFSNVSILEGTLIGNRVVIHAGSVLGSDGFGFDIANSNKKVPQVGIVQVDDDVEIGACVTIDRARLDRTIIGAGTKIDNQVQVGHNVKIGKNCILVAHVGIAGSSVLEDNVVLAAKAGVNGHVRIAKGTQVAGWSGVKDTIEEPGEQYAGMPAVKAAEWRRQVILLRQLPQMARSLKQMAARIEELEKQLAEKKSCV